MTPEPGPAGVLRGIAWRLNSIPIYLKILGIGVAVALLFGVITLMKLHAATSEVFSNMLNDELLCVGRSLASNIEKPLVTRDLFGVERCVRKAKDTFPQLRYIVVWDPSGRVVAHTFSRHVPDDLSRVPAAGTQVLSSREGLLYDGTFPILDGQAGMLRLGMSDADARQRMSALEQALLLALGFSASVGLMMAIGLTLLLTRPIHHLEEAAGRIREGDLEVRAVVRSADEIGRLSTAFNQMAEAMQQHIRRLSEKERARVSLIERIVSAQEEERKAISLELHDQIGQSLSAALLQLRSGCRHAGHDESSCKSTERSLLQLIESVQRMAWGMRPSILDDYGLDSTLSRYVRETSQRARIQIDYLYERAEGLGRPPLPVEVTLYRVAQEALTNITRHAGADRASVVVLHRPEAILLVVDDNGAGFDAAATMGDSRRSLGISGMRERASLLGGDLVIDSAPGKGTSLRVTIPLAGKEVGACPSAS